MMFKFSLTQSFDGISLEFSDFLSSLTLDINSSRISDIKEFFDVLSDVRLNNSNRDYKKGLDIETSNMGLVHLVFKSTGSILIFTKNGMEEFYLSIDDLIKVVINNFDIESFDWSCAELKEKKSVVESFIKLKDSVNAIEKLVKYDTNLNQYICVFESSECNKQVCGSCSGCYMFQMLLRKYKNLEE